MSSEKPSSGGARIARAPQHSRLLMCRRDFLNGALLGAGAALLAQNAPAQAPEAPRPSWGGYTGEGDYAAANGIPKDVMLGGHAMRDGHFDSALASAEDTKETFDLVVVGGGLSGLSAALYFRDRTKQGRTCLVLENHPIFGGEARRNEFNVDGHRLLAPQGSNFFSSRETEPLLVDFYRRVGVDWHEFEFPKWSGPGPELPLSRSSYTLGRELPSPPNYGFFFGPKFGRHPGLWVPDPWHHLDRTPLTPHMRAQFERYLTEAVRLRNTSTSDSPAEQRRLDSMTAEDVIVEKCGVDREFIRLFLAPHCAAASGLGPDALSGLDYMAAIGGNGQKTWMAFPGGNTGFARHIVKTLIPDAIAGPRTLEAVCRNSIRFDTLDRAANRTRIRLNCMVVGVQHEGDPKSAQFVTVTYARNGKLFRLRARSVVMAAGGHVTRHLVRDLPAAHREAYRQFNYSATLVANVAVRNWRFLHKLGLSGGRWFEGMGSWTEVRNIATFGSESKTIGPDLPTVLSLYIPLFYPGLPTAEQGHKGRAELLSTSFREYETRIREQFTAMFSGSGFEPQRDIAGIILNRWGHAFVNPQPGFYLGQGGKQAPGEFLRNTPFGRIAFACTDLAGAMEHGGAIREGSRAVSQLAGAIG